LLSILWILVTGETTINPSSIVQCIFKVRLDTVGSSPSDPSTPISPVDGTNPDANADTDDLARENESEASRKAKKDLLAKRPPVIAHTQYWPEDLPLRYWALIADIKSERIIIQPILLPTLKPGQEEEVILAFQAPGGAGLYTFQAMFVCSAVCGREVRHGMMVRSLLLLIPPLAVFSFIPSWTEILILLCFSLNQMTVEEPPAVPAAAAEEDDDISDPEEDSIAGQLAAMKGEKVKRKPVVEEEESDDDSSSDEDGPKKKGGDSSSSDSDSD
jgi:translocation protein SEC63